MDEALAIAMLYTTGACLLWGAGLRDRWALACFGLPIGTATYVNVGLGVVALKIAVSPWLPLLILAGGALLVWGISQVRGEVSVRYAGDSIIFIAIVAGSGALSTVILERLNFASFTPDSFRYISLASLLAQRNSLDVVHGGVLETRGLGVPYLHSLASQQGADYLASLGPLMAISGLAITAWVGHRLFKEADYGPKGMVLVVTGVVAAIVTTNRFVFHAFYINSHMLFAVWLLTTVVPLFLLCRRDNGPDVQSLLLGAGLSAAALVPLRVEGAVIAGFAVFSAMVAYKKHNDSNAHVSIMMSYLGLITLVWFGVVVARAYEDIPVATLTLAVGGGFAFILGVCDWRFVATWPRGTVVTSNLALWALLLALFVADPVPLLKSLGATAENLSGPGLWGWSILGLALILAVVTVGRKFESMAILIYPVASFLPFAFLLSYLAGLVYRVGPGDSLNRMWIHFIFVLGVILIAGGVSSPRFGKGRGYGRSSLGGQLAKTRDG